MAKDENAIPRLDPKILNPLQRFHFLGVFVLLFDISQKDEFFLFLLFLHIC